MSNGFPHAIAVGLGLAFAFALSLLLFAVMGGKAESAIEKKKCFIVVLRCANAECQGKFRVLSPNARPPLCRPRRAILTKEMREPTRKRDAADFLPGVGGRY
jgi:hypothetical protein